MDKPSQRDPQAQPSGAAEPGIRGSARAASEGLSIAGVAEQAGVSVATVSRVLNGHSNVRPATRDKVLAAVSTSGYRVNELARNLRTAESRLLLTMVPDVGNPFYAEVIRGIDSVARQHGYFMLLCDTGADAGRERSYFDLLRRRRADGAICLDPATVQQALAEESNALPWVACCEFDSSVGVPYVGIDNYRAAGDAVRHLLARGHRRIALINSDDHYLYAQQRQQGYLDALRDAGIAVDERWRQNVNSLDYEAGASAAALLMTQTDAPTAIFAVSDTLAIGVIAGLRSVGKRVPDDVAVAGFDDISLAAQIDPPLTTIAQPMRELGETAARLLLQRLANPREHVPGVLLPHRLVVRKSA
ncbi:MULTISPECIES: LacI family DNA-binding transcriptional regulator [Paraburkholderia]|uniref:LacI family DNA-binding transcriptional regulator n=1 Tax=Paraburkholderia caribensis TaxID=75105 RepID=A0A9Q6WLX8_9BURK|nr:MULTISPECIES: LacI family DNA-binding transcriptional regulator [Paraburkholderia]ALP62270.1 LacI family transcriptional regulator [Paraburkholderia caribensis]AMV43356.1 LacI family transcriptional regulator [Paraburkholderia caribensis]AUT52502.1 LacI family transcriptional regulator [Paraburkholderia caribensis]MCO4882596.1 LacI family DNA-binding transcriptional regulator [Paraburkholderia caribensis]PTB23627.1 LacI family transcriptional regulator [Paraburkholderia caribensis]